LCSDFGIHSVEFEMKLNTSLLVALSFQKKKKGLS
jgi:hypothetical protein